MWYHLIETNTGYVALQELVQNHYTNHACMQRIY